MYIYTHTHDKNCLALCAAARAVGLRAKIAHAIAKIEHERYLVMECYF